MNDKISILFVERISKVQASAFDFFEFADKFAIVLEMVVWERFFFFGVILKFLFLFLPQKLIRVFFDGYSNDLAFMCLKQMLMRCGDFLQISRFFSEEDFNGFISSYNLRGGGVIESLLLHMLLSIAIFFYFLCKDFIVNYRFGFIIY